MACFIVPMTQAIATTVIRKSALKQSDTQTIKQSDSPLMLHVPALEKMLWGGTVMLIVDHIINGEVTWKYPFFTALTETGGVGVMLREMLTVGLPMSVVLTLVWIGYSLLKERNTQTLTH